MAFGWDGATPTQQDDGAGTVYELAVALTVVEDITVTGVRVWHGAASNTVTGRSARLWTTGGAVVDTVLLDDVLPSGWTTYLFDTPVEMPAGTERRLSYSTRQYYGAVAAGLPNTSADGAVTLTGGHFAESIGTFPNSPVGTTFYGVDLVYDLGIGGNTAPELELTVTVDELEVTATVAVDDESPGSMTYRYEWGDGESTTSSSTSAVHTYAAPGLYAVAVLGTDAEGLAGVAAAVATVNAPGGGMDVEAVLDELAARLRTIDGLEVWDSIPDRLSKLPAAVVALPDEIEFDAGGRRFTDMMTVPVLVAFSRIVPRVGKRELGAFASGRGARSVKTVLESMTPVNFRGIIVRGGTFERVEFGGVPYLAVVLTARIGG